MEDYLFIGQDNGTTGSIGFLWQSGKNSFFKVPTISQLSYTKEAKRITRVDVVELEKMYVREIADMPLERVSMAIERPMVNPTRFTASMSAIRALEATLIVIEKLGISYRYIDSKEWQRKLLPKNIEGSDLLKKASLDIGKRLFPKLQIKKDADGILIAEYLKREFNKKL